MAMMAGKNIKDRKLGSLLLEIGEQARLTDDEFSIISQVRDKTPAEQSQEEKRYRMTLEALDDVDNERLISHQAVLAWADRLSTM